MYLAGNLKFLREQIGKTQQELANLFGVEQKTMSSWECGSRTPGIEIIVELARYHGVSLDDLVLRDMKPAMPVYVLNLMYLRKKHGMTQQDISELLGYRGKQGYNAIETGKAKPTIDILEKLHIYPFLALEKLTARRYLTKLQEKWVCRLCIQKVANSKPYRMDLAM